MNAWASWSTVSDSATATEIGCTSSLARGPDHHPADDDAGVGSAEQLHEAVVHALHLRARVPGQVEAHGLGLDLALVDRLLRPADGGDLGSGEDVGGDLLEVQRDDGVAEDVPHRDPALHGGHAGEHQYAGAVAGGVHPAGGGPRDTVDLDEPAVVRGPPRPPRARGRLVLGIEPSASRQCEAVTVRPSVSVTVTSSPSRVTDSIRDLESTSMPRRFSTSSRTLRRRRPRPAAPGRVRRPAPPRRRGRCRHWRTPRR